MAGTKMTKPVVSNPKDSVLWCKEAAVLIERGDEKGALYCYREAVKIEPKEADVWYNILSLAEKTGERATAFATAVTAEKMFPTDYRFPAEQARMLAGEGKYEKALEEAEKAAEINPYSPVLLSNKAAYLILSGDNEGALKTAEEALMIDPSYVSAYLHKAHALVLLGKMEEADAVLDATADDIRAIKMQANIAVWRQNLSRACEKAKEALRMNQDDDEAWSLLGAAYAYLGDMDKAKDAFSRAAKLNPKNKAYRANLAAVKKGKQGYNG